ncbi:hypothetical protein YC2023_004425 [Brassica napus]
MQPDIWEEWWRPACVLDMQPAMWSTRCRRACIRSHAERHTGCHQPEADWLVSPINTPRPQLISSHPDLSRRPVPSNRRFFTIVTRKLCPIQSVQASHILLQLSEVLSKISSVPWVQISRSSTRYCTGKSKNCPEANGGSVRVQISLSTPFSFFMVKPRLFPRQDQSSPVQSRRPLGFGQVLSDQPAASRLEHCELVCLNSTWNLG